MAAIDLNHDGKPDLIALASGMTELVWFENPGWQRHVIATGLSRMINIAASDTEIVLASGFSNRAKDSLGIVAVLRPNGDPREPWSLTEIDRLPTSHRLRWADIDGSGRRVVINAPLTGVKADAPDYRDNVPLVYYRPGEWKRETIGTDEYGVLHGLLITPWDRNGRDRILTASFAGIHLYRFDNGKWSRTQVARGESSDVAVGRLRKRRYVCAIEPWHGNRIAVYLEHGRAWERRVIEEGLVDGHTIQTADFNGDGRDDIIAGFRGKGGSVYLYSSDDPKGHRWTRLALDNGGMAAASCVIADLNGDGRLDVACIGSATANLKWYENLGSNVSLTRTTQTEPRP